MSEDKYLSYQDVRDMLNDAQKRRGFLTYEQKLALHHAEWAASDARNGYKTETKVFNDMRNAFLEIEKIAKFPDLASKLAEIIPLHSEDVRAILASRRISFDETEINQILDIVRQSVGVE